jgi:hypothetical protein
VSAAVSAHHHNHVHGDKSTAYGASGATHHVHHVSSGPGTQVRTRHIDNLGPDYGQIEYGHKAEKEAYQKPQYNPSYKQKLTYTVPTGKKLYKNVAHTEYKDTFHTVYEPHTQYKTEPYKEYKEYTKKVPHIYYKKVPHTKVTYTQKKVPYQTYHLTYQTKKVPYTKKYKSYQNKKVRHTVTTVKPYKTYVPVTKMETKIVQVPKTTKYTHMVPEHIASTKTVNYTVEYPKTEYISATHYEKKTKYVPHKVSHTEYKDKTVLIPHIRYHTEYKEEPVVTTYKNYQYEPEKVTELNKKQENFLVTHKVTTKGKKPEYH